MKKYDYLIVGAGLFGGVFAREVMNRGKTCLVVEKRNHIGGNLYCENIDGINVHSYGAHIFHTNNERVWNYVNSFVPFNRYTNSPVANYKGELYNMPFNMNTFHTMWGVRTPEEAKAIIEEQRKVIITAPSNLEEQAISLVGTDIYQKLVKGYTEKQWGKDCRELPKFIINRLPVRFTFDNNYFDDRYQGIPIGGYNPLIEGLFKGADIILNTDYLQEREKFNQMAERIVYTGTLDSFYDYRFGALEYRSLRFETEVLPVQNYQGVAVMNYTEREVPFTRIIEHKHFEFGKQPTTVITHEYPQTWESGLEPYYPINNRKNQDLYAQYAHLAAQEKNVVFGGRLAEYHYYDMDKVIAQAFSTLSDEFNDPKIRID